MSKQPVDLAAIKSWPPTVSVPTAGSTVNLGENASYNAYHRGDFPFKVLRVGRKLRVVTADIIRQLDPDGTTR